MKKNLKNSFIMVAIMIVIMVAAVIVIPSTLHMNQNINSNSKTTFEQKRDEIVSEIFSTIDKAEELEGTYRCCIDPPCTMCFLGNWIWKDGTCDCDGMIVQGEWDKVCPQCVRGIEEGRCISTKIEECLVDNKTG